MLKVIPIFQKTERPTRKYVSKGNKWMLSQHGAIVALQFIGKICDTICWLGFVGLQKKRLVCCHHGQLCKCITDNIVNNGLNQIKRCKIGDKRC